MKKTITLLAAILITMNCSAQESYEHFAVTNAMPTFTDKMKATLTYPLAWRNNRDKTFSEWRSEAKAKLMECLDPAPPVVDFDMEVIDSEQRDGYTAQKIAFNISAFERISGYLLIPDRGKKHPALVILHDHGAKFSIGKEKMIKPLKSEENRIISEYGNRRNEKGERILEQNKLKDVANQWTVACYDSVFVGDFFAKHGYVVFCADALLWGERGRKEGSLYETQEALASNIEQMGYSWCGMMTYDDINSVNLLKTIPQVDAKRIGAVGHSMGGKRTWMLAAACDDVKAAAAICWICTTDSLMTMRNNQNRGGSAWSMNVPGLARWMDYADVASIACPKPMLFYNGIHDGLFPAEGVKRAYSILHEVWDSQGAGSRLTTKLWDEKHYFNKSMQQEVLNFFDKNL
jgi:hypothetical protein